jgi:hypothetical protein
MPTLNNYSIKSMGCRINRGLPSVVSVFLLLFSSCALAETNYCNELNEETINLGSTHRPYVAEVTGSNSLYFFTAPNAQCEDKNVFIVPGDLVTIHNEYEDYSQISYSSKSNDYSAWVRSDRLKIIAKPYLSSSPSSSRRTQ